MLYEFHNKHTEHFATISICGLNKEGMYRTVVVPRAEVDTARLEFSKIMTEFIYSLHINKSSQWQEEVAQLDLAQMSALFAGDGFVEKLSGISNVSCDLAENVLLPAGTKVSVTRIVPDAPTRTVSASAPASSSGFGTKPAPSSTSSASSSKPAPSKAAVSSAVAGFFGKSSAPAKPKPVAAPPVAAPAVVESTCAPSSASTRVIQDDEDDDEWDDGSGYKPKKSNLSKRVAKSILDDDEAWDSASKNAQAAADSTTAMDIENVDNADQTKAKRGKHAIVQRGAMDDFVNDGSFEGDAKVVASAGNGTPGERKKKLVEKTFENAKGYLVTEMVWEEISEEEEAEMARQASVAAAAAEKRAAAVAAKKAAAPPPKKTSAGGAQKGMMSFFGKKA